MVLIQTRCKDRTERNTIGPMRQLILCLAAILIGLIAAPTLALPVISVAQKKTTLNSGGSFNFGTIRQDRSLLQTFTITNNGDSDLTISNTTVAPPYSIEQGPVSPVRPGKRTTVRVRLPEGTTAGPVTGLLSIVNDDPGRTNFTITLNANVQPVVPDLSLSQASTSIPNGSTFDLGTFEAGIAIARKFTIQNTGNANLNLGNPSITGTGFTLEFPKTRSLRPGKKLTFTIRFFQPNAGESLGQVSLPSNDPDASTFAFLIFAQSTPADSSVRAFSQGDPIENGGTVRFGTVRSDRRVDRTITIRNEGRSNLIISGLTISGQGYSILSQPRSPLGRGKSTKFKIRLMPGDSEMQTGALSFQTNDPDNDLFTMNLLAGIEAVSPGIQVNSATGTIVNGASIEVGETNLNIALNSAFTVTNTGTSDLTLGTVMLTGTGFELTGAPSNETIRPGRNASTPISVRLQSAAPLSASAQISFSTTVPGVPTFSFTVTGTVRIIPPSPEIEVNETFVNDFGATVSNVLTNNAAPRVYATNLPSGNARLRSYIIRNIGTAPMTLSGPTLINTVGSAFSIVQAGFMLPNMLAAGATAPTFTVQFLPTSPGPYAATLSFMNDDPDDNEGPTFTISIAGTAVAALQRARLTYAGISGPIRVQEEPNPMPPHYPFSFGSVPAGGTSDHFAIDQDGLIFENIGQSPIIVFAAMFDLFNIWMAMAPAQPPPPAPAIPLAPIDGQALIDVTHSGITPGPSVAVLSIQIDAMTSPALVPWLTPFQEWVVDWFAAGGGLGTGPVRALLDFDPDGNGNAFQNEMYAAGDFTMPGGSPKIAVYSGGNWNSLTGGGVNTAGGSVRALAAYNEPGPTPTTLFAAGSFNSVGNPAVTANNIARWDGNIWTVLGPAVTNGLSGGSVNALAVFPPSGASSELYAGGAFTSAGLIVGFQGIAKWNGTAWTKLAATNDGVSGGEIRALAVFNDRLYAGGTFPNVTSLPTAANGIASWNGTSWSLLGPPTNAGVTGSGARVNAMVVFDADGPDGPTAPTLVVAGSFTNASNIVNVNNIAQWTGSVWQRLDSGIPGGEVFSLAVFDEDAFHPSDEDGSATSQRTMPGRLYAAGNFMFALPSGETVTNVVRWNGRRWGPVGTVVANGTNGDVLAMRPFDADGRINGSTPNNPAVLFLGGNFTEVQKLSPANPNFSVPNIAVWGWTAP